MATLYELACVSIASNNNTGVVDCPYNPKALLKHVLIPKGTTFTSTQVATMTTTLQALLSDDKPSKRAYLTPLFEDIEPMNSEPKGGETTQGMKYVVGQGFYGFKGTYTQGGLNMHTSMSAFHNKQDLYDILFFDFENNVILGTVKNGLFAGFDLGLIQVDNITMTNGSGDRTKYSYQIQLADADELNLNWATIQLDKTVGENVKDFTSLKQLKVTAVGVLSATGLVSLKLLSGGVNLFSIYQTEFATASLYKGYNVATGALLTITSVTANTTKQTFDVQFTATGSWPTTAGSLVKIDIGLVSNLNTAGIKQISEGSLQIARA